MWCSQRGYAARLIRSALGRDSNCESLAGDGEREKGFSSNERREHPIGEGLCKPFAEDREVDSPGFRKGDAVPFSIFHGVAQPPDRKAGLASASLNGFTES